LTLGLAGSVLAGIVVVAGVVVEVEGVLDFHSSRRKLLLLLLKLLLDLLRLKLFMLLLLLLLLFLLKLGSRFSQLLKSRPPSLLTLLVL
jgi:hypothetical protein